jgi:hypothetical protein
MFDPAKLIQCATDALIDSMGVAAQFVAQDAWDAAALQIHASYPNEVVLRLYLKEYVKLLPPGVSESAIRADIARRLQR